MKKIVVLLAMILGIGAQSQTIGEIVAQSEADIKSGNAVKAISSLDNAIAANPSAYELHHAKGRAYVSLEKFQGALDSFAKALELNPKAADVYASRALLLNVAGYFDQALSDSENSLLHAVGNDQKNLAINIRADAKRLKKDYAGAIKDYEAVLAGNPDASLEVNSLIQIAKAYGAQNKNEEAIAYLERLTTSYPEMSVGFTNLAFRYAEIGNYQKAIELNDKVIALEQRTKKDKNGVATIRDKFMVDGSAMSIALAYNNKGFAQFKLGNSQAALASVNKSIELYPENSYAYRNRALIYLGMQNKIAACLDLAKSIELGFTQTYGDEVQRLNAENCR